MGIGVEIRLSHRKWTPDGSEYSIMQFFLALFLEAVHVWKSGHVDSLPGIFERFDNDARTCVSLIDDTDDPQERS